MKLSIETCADALRGAAMNRKAAFQTELAVGLAVFLHAGDTTPEARTNLCAAYAGAGYQCLTTSGIDYKTINRRINATAELFHRVPVATWAGKHSELLLLKAITLGLEPYELLNVQDVVRFCNPQKLPPKTRSVEPHTGILAGPTTGQGKVIDLFRRAADAVAKGARHVETKHLALMVPDSASRDELIELAGKLLAMANELLTA